MSHRTLLPLLTLCCFTSLAFSQSDTITILHINDTHSILPPLGPRTPSLEGTQGGIARLAYLLGRERLLDTNAILLHAGDFSIGDLSYVQYFGVPELRILSAVGLTAMAVGNHEFDLTPSTLLLTLDSAFSSSPPFPLLSANLVLPDPSVEPLAKYISPNTIKQAGNVRVGIFGLTTPATNLISQPGPAVIDTNIIPIAAAMVDTLTNRGCSVIICLSHLGLWVDSLVARYVPGITLIVGGHDHYLLSSPHVVQNVFGGTAWIVQTDGFTLNAGKLRLAVDPGEVSLVSYEIIPLDLSMPQDTSVAVMVADLIAGIEATYGPMFSAQVATVPSLIPEFADSVMFYGPRDTPTGNLITDAFRAATGTDIAIETCGSTAMPFYPGPIVGADVFRAIGYGFNTDNGLGYRIATFSMTGAALMVGLEFGLSDLEHGDEYLIQVSGMQYQYDSRNAPFGRVTGVTIGGQPLNPAATYTITANEFVPQFLSVIGIPYADLHVFSDTTETQVLLAAVQAMGTVIASAEGRVFNIAITGVSDGQGALPEHFRLDQNYPNPFNPRTTIRFVLPYTARISISVHNVLGQLVTILVDGVFAEGEHAVEWDAASAATGCYFYTLTAGAVRLTRKMTLVR
ncbi:MAG: 5'-nucleotidase C-terminal domain-containing protein [Bacteroidota bacterium]